jgi:hypothetical protein
LHCQGFFYIFRDMKCIYTITNPSGKIYIGKTTDLQRRLRRHKYDSKYKLSKLYNSIRKYGWDAHKVDILLQADCSTNLLDKLEIMYIKQYNTQHTGLNTALGGCGGSNFTGKKHTDQSLAKIRQASIDRWMNNDERRNAICKAVSKPVAQLSRQGDLIHTWPSATQAAVFLGIKKASICNNLKGRSSSAGGYVWTYI